MSSQDGGGGGGGGGLFGLLRGRESSQQQPSEPPASSYQQAVEPAAPAGGAAEERRGLMHPVSTDATQTDDGGYVTWEERFGGLLSTRQSRTILAVGVSAIAALFVLFLGIGHSGAATHPSPAGGHPTAGPGVTIKTVDDAPVGSPTNPNPRKREPGCPALGNAPPGRRYIQIKNNCKESIWPGILPAGAALPPDNSWLWKTGECKTMNVASSLPSLRVWARTGCDADFRCVSGTCRTEGSGGCASAGEAPCTLWEATLQDHCTPTPQAGMGPDFFDVSLVDGFNVNIKATVSGGYNVGQVLGAFSCQTPVANAFDYEACPYELRVYQDAIPGTVLPVEGWNGKNVETSPCFKTPLTAACRQSVIGCRSLCKSLDQGWIGFYIDNVQGDKNLVDPIVARPTGQRLRWSQQFLQSRPSCGTTLCRDIPAWGAYRGATYASHGLMKNLVCCDGPFRCSPYQPNSVPGGCPWDQMCPTLGSADPASPFHGRRGVDDSGYPQFDEEIRKSSSEPDWPLPTKGAGYATIYKLSSPVAYSWQYSDLSSTFTCCGKDGDPSKPTYILTFCPSD